MEKTLFLKIKKALLFLLLGVLLSGFIGVVLFKVFNPKPALEESFIQPQRRIRPEEKVSTASGFPTQKIQPEVKLKEPGERSVLTNPYHVYQTFNNCGPATLSMIMAYFDVSVSQEELADKIRPYQHPKGDNDDKTIFSSEFVTWANSYGLKAVSRVNGDIQMLKWLTSNNIPVVVKTWLKQDEDIGHFRLVKGFDESKQVIIQDDSYEGKDKEFSYYDFLKLWQPFNYNYIVVYKPEQEALVKAILKQEWQEQTAWENALSRAQKETQLTPDNPYPLFNQATSFYHLGEYEKTVQIFKQVEQDLPKRMLWYQIEPVKSYQQLGRYDEALALIARILSSNNKAFSELYQIRGEIYYDQGKKQEAKQEFEQALFYNKNYQEPLKWLEKISSE